MNSLQPPKPSRVPLTICIVLFFVTFFLNKDFSIPYLYNYLFVLAFLGLSLLLDRRIYISNANMTYLFLVLVVVIFSFLPWAIKDAESNNHAISIVLFFLCCALSIPSEKELKLSATIVVTWAILISLYTIMVKVYPGVYWNHIYPHLSAATQSEADHLMKIYSYGVAIGGSATYADYIMAAGLFITVGSLFSGYKKKRAPIFVGLALIFFLGMVIQNRRGELFSLIISLLLIYMLSINPKAIELKRFKIVIGTAFILFIGIAFMYSRGMLDRYIDTFAELSSNNAGGLESVGNGRIVLWKETFRQFSKSPVFGIGWNQFRARNAIPYMQGVNVHNDYLQWLCEAGLVGFVLIAVPTFYLWFKAMKRCRKMMLATGANINNKAIIYAIVSCGIQTFFIVLHLMDPCFYKLMFWPMYSISIILYNMSFYHENTEEILLAR